MSLLLFVLAWGVALGAVPPAPATASTPPEPAAIDAATLQRIALDAVAAAAGDGGAAVRALDAKVKQQWGDVLTEPLSVSDSPTEVHLFSPYAAYRKSFVELLKRGQPIDRLAFSPVAIVLVAPARVDAPDVTAITVTRDGANVAAVVNQLTLRPITSRLGVTERLHAGYVAFPLAAFAPGGRVTVSAALDGAPPLTLTLDPTLLTRFR